VDHPPRRTRDGIVERRDYVLTLFETGRHVVPSLDLSAVASGETTAVRVDSVTVTVSSVLPDTLDAAAAEPRDIAPPVDLPREIWPYLLIAGLAAAAAVGWWLVRRYLVPWLRRPREESEPEPEPVPKEAAHIAAFERLRALREDDPVGRGDIDAFYVRVTSVLKAYVRDRWAVDVVDMTTEEVGPAMKSASIEQAVTERLVAFLRHADLPKFARAVPAAERARSDLDEAWDFVETTRLRGEEGE
jgi:hypothetical protein